MKKSDFTTATVHINVSPGEAVKYYANYMT